MPHQKESTVPSRGPGYQRRKTLPAIEPSKSQALARTLATQRRRTVSVTSPRRDCRSESTAKDYQIHVSCDDMGSKNAEEHTWAEDALGEFEREFRRLAGLPPRLPTPPKWVPPWAKTRAQARPRLATVLPMSGDALPGSPLPSRRHQKEESDMLSNVLSTLLPAAPSKLLRPPRVVYDQDATSNCTASPIGSPFGGSPTSSTYRVSEDEDRKRSEVLAFCSTLVRRFGNTTRAFRAMKQAAQAAHRSSSQKAFGSQGLEPLSKSEFEWCVTSLLRYGNRRMAFRLFATLDSGFGDIAVSSLNRNLDWVEDLLSLFQLRQNLLDRFGSFEEIAEALRWATNSGTDDLKSLAPTPLARSVSRRDFVAAVGSLGVCASQAIHLFLLLDFDGKGMVELSQFMHAIEEIPTELTWRDLRQRLLAKQGSMADALRCLDATNSDLSESELGRIVTRCEIPGFQALQLGGSSAISASRDLRRMLRAAAPAISLQDFWQRVATEWPQVAEAAAARHPVKLNKASKASKADKADKPEAEAQTPHAAQRCLETLLSELLPEFHETCSNSESNIQVLPSLSFEMFDALSCHVDVSQENARELFHCIASTAAALDETTGEALQPANLASSQPSSSVFVEDFAEQLTMWAETSEPKGSKRTGAAERVRQVVAPVRAAISALKAELQPTAESTAETAADDARRSETSELQEPHREAPLKGLSRSKMRRRSKLPWCTYYRCCPS